jgi:hypothetical protein
MSSAGERVRLEDERPAGRRGRRWPIRSRWVRREALKGPLSDDAMAEINEELHGV